MSGKLSYEEVAARLEQAEALLDALRSGAVDGLVGRSEPLIITAKSVLDDRAQLHEQIEAERASLQALVDATPAAVLLLDAHECVARANPEAQRLFGSAPSSSGPSRCGDLGRCVHRHDDPRGCGHGPACQACAIDFAIKQALAGAITRNAEVRMTAELDGATATYQYVLGAAPVSLEDGPGVALVLQDITQLKAALAEREKLHAALAQSDRLASMGVLAAGVAHEINNPLSYVLYNIESAVEDLPRVAGDLKRCRDALSSRFGDEEVGGVLDQALVGRELADLDDIVSRLREAVSGARRIKEISRGLGTFTRVEQKAGPVHIHAAIEHALAMAFNQIKYRARVVKDYGSVPPVLAVDGALAQVFLNLLMNAAHAIDEGHVEENEIRLRTWADGEWVFAEVSDTGTGIAPEHRDRIFEPFFTTKGIGTGTGLGLSISRNIVTGFGGEITFETEVGRGTRFRVKLPRLPRDWVAESPISHRVETARDIRGRVLVIDDEEAIRAIVTRMLRRDHEVVAAASGEEARAILSRDSSFDVIFCDMMMPRVSGMELHAWLAENDPESAGRVVFMTGGAFTPRAAEYLSKTGNLRLEKPFDALSFRKLVGELIVAARSRSGSRKES
ncbi:MAG: ATP-binding protein [Vicinamibacterales bacterium]